MSLLHDHVLIITGSTSGIGLVTATLALSEGAKVLGVDVSSAPKSLNENPNFKFLQRDLTDAASAKDIVDTCVRQFGGRIDGLLNIAGIMDHNGSVDSLTDEMWDQCIAINLTAPVKLMREVIPIMRAQRSGSIVNVGSKAATSGAASGVAYTASKHGLIGATKNVAWRYKQEGVRCNAVCPGGVPTGIVQASNPDLWDNAALETMSPVHQAHASDRPKGLGVEPDDIAQCLLFLISKQSKRISGAVIPIDNAWSVI
ncbi:Short-chain dehydrogenase/reductase SDR [Penicillium daleae]|uniref:Short-chain dehydrogenase/reductase SDR n=1 Tax=Penicillium daleae TaxID=63821 RepID=A0AAD6G8F4_9EURO|nr:Short-chain dehydrogenase/reductase SDR [Penicillium daleae]KAJ5464396.1 Short-chain dehydrogenase/reductase SDR [Penicillium daleae]